MNKVLYMVGLNSQIPNNNIEGESVGDYEKQLQFDSMEVLNRPKKKQKTKHPGGVDEGEEPRAIRELREETGVTSAEILMEAVDLFVSGIRTSGVVSLQAENGLRTCFKKGC